MPKTEFRIDLLGTSIQLRSDEEPVYLNNLLNRYRQLLEQTQKKFSLRDPLKDAIITGFILCDEYERLHCSINGMAPPDALEAEKITLDLINKIEKALPDTLVSEE
jgi:hypothetical protein